ncbi:MAG TPA: SH3 domain-containing protein [Micropepsaceae bacterium]|nr:SH3 domain-containing protein [Micropepsaceae bacterium]
MRFTRAQTVRSQPPAAHSAATAIPLGLSALVAPYREHGTLLFRIERLPRRARLTLGRNNGNSTWTLNENEIENARYVPPAGAEHTADLSLRVIAMPSGDTIALLTVPVAPVTKPEDVSGAIPLPPPQSNKSDAAASNEAGPSEEGISEPVAGSHGSRAGQATLLTKGEERTQALVAETLAALDRQAGNALQNAEEIWKEPAQGTRQDVQTALADAERQWKTAEAARRAAEDLQWQQRLDAAVAQARAEAATHLRSEDGEVQRLRQEMEGARSTLAAREAELAAAREQAEQLQAGLERNLESALQQAGAKWKTAEAARRAEAEAQWREQTAKALTEALSKAEKAHEEQTQSDLARLNGELSAAHSSLAGSKAELAELQSEFSRAQTDWQHEKDTALSAAEKQWRSAEAVRLTVAKAEWQAESNKALADARAEVEAIRAEYAAGDTHRLRTALAEREEELTQLRAALIEERGRLHKESAEQLLEAEKNWKLDEISRMTQAKEQWQAQTAKAVAEARTSAKPAREVAGDIELRRLRAEYTALQATLTARELELKRAKQATGETQDIVLKTQRIRSAASDERDQKKRGSSGRGLWLAVGVLAAAAGVALFLNPNLLDGVLQSPPQVQLSAAQATPSPPPAPQPEQKHAVLARGANLRDAPSGDAPVMLSLPKGTEVVALERKGNWTRIQVTPDGKSAGAREGWVFTSFLKDAGASDTPQ